MWTILLHFLYKILKWIIIVSRFVEIISIWMRRKRKVILEKFIKKFICNQWSIWEKGVLKGIFSKKRMAIKGRGEIILEVKMIWRQIGFSIRSLHETFIRAFFDIIIRIPPIRHLISKWSKAFYQALSKAWLALFFLLNIASYCRRLIIIGLVNISFPSIIIITITSTTTKTSKWPAKITKSGLRRIVWWFCRHIEFSSLGIKILCLRNLSTNLSSWILRIRFTF